MNWTKLLYVLIIVLLYVPMVFLGANVFFPEYTGVDSYFHGRYPECFTPMPEKVGMTTAERNVMMESQQKCQKEYDTKQRQWEQEKLAYEGRKYVYITLFNFVILLMALVVPKLQDSIVMGLFLGSIAATFGATIRYFDTRSKIGFLILVITFFTMLYFINKKKDYFIDWNTKKN